MAFLKSVLLAVLAGATANAHMVMSDPKPMGQDDNYSAPLKADGSDFPCKGKLAGYTPGSATTAWTAGSKETFSIGPGGARHEGGSCQASLSEDGGKTFKVMRTYIGNCPKEGGGTFDFTVPASAKSGEAIFAWTWFNLVGNRLVPPIFRVRNSFFSKKPPRLTSESIGKCT